MDLICLAMDWLAMTYLAMTYLALACWRWAELGDDGGWWWMGMGAGQFWNGHLVAGVGIGDRVGLCCGGV